MAFQYAISRGHSTHCPALRAACIYLLNGWSHSTNLEIGQMFAQLSPHNGYWYSLKWVKGDYHRFLLEFSTLSTVKWLYSTFDLNLITSSSHVITTTIPMRGCAKYQKDDVFVRSLLRRLSLLFLSLLSFFAGPRKLNVMLLP